MDLLSLYKETLNASYTTLEEEDASYAYKKNDDGTLHIWFEQSNGATDWKNNLDFWAKPYSDMPYTWYAHRGFVRVWKIIRDAIADVIIDENVTNIIIAGYSHGAALALLCHEYCVYNRPDLEGKIEGYGFGCPRVAWGILPKEVKKRFEGFHVIRNKKDIVTHVPPVIFGYRHVGELITVGEGNNNWIKSHYANNYITALTTYTSEQSDE